MDQSERDSERKKWWGMLSCINVTRHGNPNPIDLWYATIEAGGTIRLPDETQHVPRRVKLETYSLGLSEPVADFFIDNPSAKWLLLQTERITGSGWHPKVIASGHSPEPLEI